MEQVVHKAIYAKLSVPERNEGNARRERASIAHKEAQQLVDSGGQAVQ